MSGTSAEGGPGRKRPFYGWLLVLVTILDGAFSSGTGVWGFSVFVRPMTAELGWTRSAMYGALTARSLLSGVFAPVIGPMQDTRNGPRLLAIITTLTMVIAVVAQKWAGDLVWFYIIFGGMGALASFGSSEMLMTAVLPKWFIRSRGRALGIASIGTAMGPLIFPLLVTALVEGLGWRDAWLALGLLTLVILGPLSATVRTRPEDLGLLPDGDAAPVEGAAPRRIAALAAVHNYTRAEAVRTPSFWLLTGSFSLAMLTLSGMFGSLVPYFQDIGFSTAEGGMATAAYGVGSISTRVFWGALCDRYPVRNVMALQAAVTALSIAGFLAVQGLPGLLLAGFAHGLAIGGFFVMRPLIVANYFGRGHLGAINGIVRPFVTFASAFSPLLFAGMYDATGSYVTPFWIAVICWGLAAATALLAKPPVEPNKPPATA